MRPIRVYCDESRPEALIHKADEAKCLCIGSLWVAPDTLDALKLRMRELRATHGKLGEIKWGKVSPSSVDFSSSLIDAFFDLGAGVRFRSIVVDSRRVNLSAYHEGDAELGFYKFYYQLLKPKIIPPNRYQIFCDLKVNRDSDRIRTLERCLRGGGRAASVSQVQALPSHEVDGLQLCDLLLGAVSAKFNNPQPNSTAKRAVVAHLEGRLGHPIRPTYLAEEKFNIFRINPGMTR